MKVLGIVNFEDDSVKIDGLGDYRPVPAVSFMGRYRIIDVILSNMTNSGIDNVHVSSRARCECGLLHSGTRKRRIRT